MQPGRQRELVPLESAGSWFSPKENEYIELLITLDDE
jgi:hypothetical protein